MPSRSDPPKKLCGSVDLRDKSRNERQKALFLGEVARLRGEVSGQREAKIVELRKRSEILCNDADHLIAAAKELRKGHSQAVAKNASR